MNAPSISLRRSLDFTMNDILRRIKTAGGKNSQAIIEEYREWINACDESNGHPHLLYINKININIRNDT